MSNDKLFGDLSMIQGQFRDLTSTVKATKALQVTHEWLLKYGYQNGWGRVESAAIEELLKTKRWKGIPVNASSTRIQIASTILKRTTDKAPTLQVANGMLWRAKMTGIGLAKHPSWVGESLLALSLVYKKSVNLPSLSILCESKLPLMANILSGAARKPLGLDFGGTKEVKVEDSSTTAGGFRLYSADPSRIGSTLQKRIKHSVDGWTGHIRFQAIPAYGLGIFMVWDWRGDQHHQWSKDLDKAIAVVQGVRDACVTM